MASRGIGGWKWSTTTRNFEKEDTVYDIVETKEGWRVIDSKGEFASIPQTKTEAKFLADLFNKMRF